MKERIEYIDLAKGLCIMLVVFYHASGILNCTYCLSPFLDSFRLPLYFVLAGLFFRDYGSVRMFLLKKTNRLLVPFFAFYIAFSVIIPNLLHYAMGVEFGTVVGWKSLWAFVWPGEYPNVPIWFLWCLFVINVMFWGIRAVSQRLFGTSVMLAMFAMCSALCVLGYYLQGLVGADFATLFKSMQSIPYFCIGHMLGVGNGLKALDGMSMSKRMFAALVLILLTFVVSMQLAYYSDYLGILAGVFGALMVIVIASIVKYVPFVSYLGRYSIILLLTHGLLLRLLEPLCREIATVANSYVAVLATTVLALATYIVIIPFSCKFIPKLTAQRPLLKE